MTLRSIILGILLTIILGAANAYLGLFAGMTISASIPAAVLSMGVLSLLKDSSIKENNLVQTAASAGESLAAGVIFTIPALILIQSDTTESIFKGWETFDYLKVFSYSLLGGIMGIFFTIPLRKALIERAKLSYPEGQATAKVLQVGENARRKKSKKNHVDLQFMIKASIFGAAIKLMQSGFNVITEKFHIAFIAFKSTFAFASSLSPALISVGFIIGKRVSLMVFSGGAFAWLIILPIISINTDNNPDINLIQNAEKIWNDQIRYVGVGAMLVGGLWSLLSVFKFILSGFRKSNKNETKYIKKDIPKKWVIIGMTCVAFILTVLYNQEVNSIGLSIMLSILMIFLAFIFSAVAAYMAGVVGSSNNPISGVTIATIMISSLVILSLTSPDNPYGPLLSILIGSVVCCAAAIGGDNMQDLKAGHIINASPWKQQVMQIIGVISAAAIIGLVLTVLHDAYGIGGKELPAPQANLMKLVSVGIFSSNLPWNMISIGVIIAILIIIYNIIFKTEIHILAVAVGIYLPIELSTPILIGGLISSKIRSKDKGILIGSGIITGEALMGILIALPIFISGNKEWWPKAIYSDFSIILGIIIFCVFIEWFYRNSQKSK